METGIIEVVLTGLVGVVVFFTGLFVGWYEHKAMIRQGLGVMRWEVVSRWLREDVRV